MAQKNPDECPFDPKKEVKLEITQKERKFASFLTCEPIPKVEIKEQPVKQYSQTLLKETPSVVLSAPTVKPVSEYRVEIKIDTKSYEFKNIVALLSAILRNYYLYVRAALLQEINKLKNGRYNGVYLDHLTFQPSDAERKFLINYFLFVNDYYGLNEFVNNVPFLAFEPIKDVEAFLTTLRENHLMKHKKKIIKGHIRFEEEVMVDRFYDQTDEDIFDEYRTAEHLEYATFTEARVFDINYRMRPTNQTDTNYNYSDTFLKDASPDSSTKTIQIACNDPSYTKPLDKIGLTPYSRFSHILYMKSNTFNNKSGYRMEYYTLFLKCVKSGTPNELLVDEYIEKTVNALRKLTSDIKKYSIELAAFVQEKWDKDRALAAQADPPQEAVWNPPSNLRVFEATKTDDIINVCTNSFMKYYALALMPKV